MRIFYILFSLFIVFAISIILLRVVGFAFGRMDEIVNSVLLNISRSWGSNVNLTDYDVMQKLRPFIIAADYALIIASLFVIVALFIYSRRRS